MGIKFFRCAHCGQIITKVNETPVPVICCGEPMQELVPGTTDAAAEKHVPEYAVNGNIVDVTVGSVIHPMEEAHYIQWIALQTNCGWQLKRLQPGTEPKAQFVLSDGEKVEAVFEYCNLHSLWCK